MALSLLPWFLSMENHGYIGSQLTIRSKFSVKFYQIIIKTSMREIRKQPIKNNLAQAQVKPMPEPFSKRNRK